MNNEITILLNAIKDSEAKVIEIAFSKVAYSEPSRILSFDGEEITTGKYIQGRLEFMIPMLDQT